MSCLTVLFLCLSAVIFSVNMAGLICPVSGGASCCPSNGRTRKRCSKGNRKDSTQPEAGARYEEPRFQAENPRACGRADVGLRCVSAALFRSQGLRRNTQANLHVEPIWMQLKRPISPPLALTCSYTTAPYRSACPLKPATTPSKFRAPWPEARSCQESHCSPTQMPWQDSESMVRQHDPSSRGLVPDEPRLASRVFEAFESYFAGRGLPDPEEDPEAALSSKPSKAIPRRSLIPVEINLPPRVSPPARPGALQT